MNIPKAEAEFREENIRDLRRYADEKDADVERLKALLSDASNADDRSEIEETITGLEKTIARMRASADELSSR